MKVTGIIDKMPTLNINPVQYFLTLGNEKILVNDFLDKTISLRFTGRIICTVCGKKTNKSFGEGFCYNCFMNSPENAECIIRPELCRAHLNEGRDVEWEIRNHMQPHFVYMAITADVKVGVTRDSQIPTRWIDQGAAAATIIAQTPYRQLAGAIEVTLKEFFSDKTHWTKMLSNAPSTKSIIEERDRAISLLPDELKQYTIKDSEIVSIQYPVLKWPDKVKSIGFEKEALIHKKLTGIRGQYLMFDDNTVLNVRKHSGFEIELNA